mmetsp:Transcript_22958/g.25318  ORF Transcript_22958/g.25318 Transcript_22958/m.25318 type:complete len:166 (+) Transcript_22958:106-603(+)
MILFDDISTITNEESTFSSSIASSPLARENTFLRLYNTSTKVQTQNKWIVYKRAQEERKKKIIPKDNLFLAYGTTIINQSPPWKQCSPTMSLLKKNIPRKRSNNKSKNNSSSSVDSNVRRRREVERLSRRLNTTGTVDGGNNKASSLKAITPPKIIDITIRQRSI